MAFEPITAYFTAKNQKAPAYAGDVDVSKAQNDALRANIQNMPEMENVLSRGNQFNQQQNLSLLESAIPGYSKWASQMGANANAYANGTISNEQAGNLSRLAAERGINVGSRGQANNFSLLRDLGIDQYQAGNASMGIMGTLASMAKVNPMSPMSMMVTPQQGLSVAESNRSAKQAWLNADQASKNVSSNAFWAGLAAGDATFQQAMGMGGGSGGGGSMGGGGWGQFMKMGQSSSSQNSYGMTSHGTEMGDSFGGGMTDMGSDMGGMS